MRDLMPELLDRWATGEPVALATVVSTMHSAPRPAGAALMVDSEGSVVGSVSGGCVEGAVYELAREVTVSGHAVLERYGVSHDDEPTVGLTCGGTLDVFVEMIDRNTFPDLDKVAADLVAGEPVAIATVIRHPDRTLLGRRLVLRPATAQGAVVVSGSLGSESRDVAVHDDAVGLLAAGHSEILTYGPDGERRGEGMQVFVRIFAPRPRLIIFGAIDFAAALAHVGKFVGYQVVVCDARAVFATRARLPSADEVVVDWPHRYLAEELAAGRLDDRTVIAVLTHDPKFDVPLLEVALRIPTLAYVGAMGSRRTHSDRMARLRAAGLQPFELARLHSPIGLDLGARTTEETAISIIAEILAHRWGGSGSPLSATMGRIHHDRANLVTVP